MNKILFPNNSYLQKGFAPISSESNINHLNIIGKIPEELNGTFFRNGSNPQYVFSENYHIWDGDGMVHALNFSHGKVHYFNRWVKTERFELERKAERSLFAGMRDYGKSDESVKNNCRNTANTSIIWHGEKLLALQEGSLPVRLDKSNLNTLGNWTFDQQLSCSMTAHPCHDPITGELLFYSYINPPIEDDIYYYSADKTGKVQRTEKINIPFLSIMHDFVITQDYAIFPVFPLTLSYKRFMNGGVLTAWDPTLGTHFGIMPRKGSNQDIIWFEDEPCYAFHFFNAYQNNDKIILDAMAINNIPDDADPFKQGESEIEVYPLELVRWVFDLRNKKLTKEILDNVSGELPRIDERFMGRKYQHGYVASTIDKEIPYNLFDSITHYNVDSGQKKVHNFGLGHYTGEPIFVPKNKDSAEGDGYILAYVYHELEDRSDCVILNAQHIDAEPLAIIQLPHRVPYGFHGCWVNS